MLNQVQHDGAGGSFYGPCGLTSSPTGLGGCGNIRHPELDSGSVEEGILAYTAPVVRQAHQPVQGDG